MFQIKTNKRHSRLVKESDIVFPLHFLRGFLLPLFLRKNKKDILPKKTSLSYTAGLTLIEVMLSLAILGTIAGFSMPVYQSFISRNDIDITSSTIISTLRQAQTFSQGMSGDSAWGVKLSSGELVIFRGDTYASRDVFYDESVSLPGSITLSGLSEVGFEKLTGYSNTSGTITIQSVSGETMPISINEKGIIFPNTSLSFGDWGILNQVATVSSVDTENSEKIQVAGEYTYIVRSGNNPDLQVYNISDPSSPTLVGTLSLSGNPTNLFVSNGYAYISSTNNSSELQVVNVTSPSSPQLVGLYDAPGSEDGLGIYVAGTHAYLVRSGSAVNNNFISLDVSDPNSPTLLGSTLIDGTLFELVVSGSYAYISSSDNNEELKIINVSDPTDTGLNHVAGLNFPGNSDSWSIALSGSNLIMDDGGWFMIISISNPANPTLLSNNQTLAGFIYDISISSVHGANGHTYAFLVTDISSKELMVMDITNPLSPINVANYDNTGVGTLRGVAYSPFLDRVFVSAINDKELVVLGPN